MKYCFLLCAWLSVFSPLAFSQVGPLIWEDNFNIGRLDTTKWSYETGTGVNGDFGTGQIDRATDRPENVHFQDSVPGAEDGCMVITTRKEFYIDRNYTSGRILSRGKSAWGPGHRIVARVYPRDVRHPGQGFAFWMMPDEVPDGWDYLMWPQGGEVDIMEYVGAIPRHNLGSVHYAWSWENNQWQSWNHGHKGAYYSYEQQEVPSPSEPGYGGYPAPNTDPNAGSNGFHTYGIDWFEDRMEFFIDGHVYHIHYFEDGGAFPQNGQDGQDGLAVMPLEGRRVARSEYGHHFPEWHPFSHRMFLILSAGVGGGQYSYGGAVVPEAEFPCSVFIDWVKVYELNTTTGVASPNAFPPFHLYPNPATDELTISIERPTRYRVSVQDAAGKTVLSDRLDERGKLNIAPLAKGAYVLTLSEGEKSTSQRFVVD